MRSSPKKLLYIEVGEWHFDLFPSFFRLLANDYTVDLLINQALLNKLPQEKTWNQVWSYNFKKNFGRLRSLWKFLWLSWSGNYDQIFFNTAQGSFVRLLVLLAPPGVQLAGVHHNAQKFLNSQSQKVISWRLKKYIVLAEFIVKSLKSKISESLKLISVYPIYHEGLSADLKSINNGNNQNRKNNENTTLKIAIVGVVEKSRRDYFGLVEWLDQKKPQRPIEFVILGNSEKGDDPELKQLVRTKGLEKYFRFWDGFVFQEVIHQQLCECDLVMPLVMPNDVYFPLYFETKISGSYSLAFGYRKPLLMHEVFKTHKELAPFSIFFGSDFSNILDDRASLIAQSQSIYELMKKNENFDFLYQQKKIVEFLNQ